MVYEKVIELARELSKKRHIAAIEFSKQVGFVLHDLGMPFSEFEVAFSKENDNDKPVLSLRGFDKLEFLIAPNPGESTKPLVKIASGGELSRIALAIKSILSSRDEIETMIFDEIDSGIGGEVALSVSTHMKKLSASKQILCVTHLAILAARATCQFKVEKQVREGRTTTDVVEIQGKERQEEIARMLAGDKNRAASLAHAIDLLERFGKA
jgi:DNA repair protein RecN (Recombination protein N)